MTTEAYPLQWPHGRPRTKPDLRKRARFSKQGHASHQSGASYRVTRELSVADAVSRLILEAERIDARGLVISSNLELRMDGLPRSNQRLPADPGVCVYFDLDGKARAMPCDTYDSVQGNIAAVAAHIEATRLIERHGVATVSEMFAGFAALPAPSHMKPKRPWHEVLGLQPGTRDREAIETMFRIKAKQAHPDAGGSSELMHELNEAKREALA